MNMQKILSKLSGRRYKKPRPSLNNLDQKLEKYLNFRDGFFIEAGANDGYLQSNTYFLEKERDWRGVLVEGIPELYQRCVLERPNATVYYSALVSSDFQQATVTMHYAHLMSVVEGSLKTAEQQDEHLQAGVDIQHLDGSYSIDVPAQTLESILDNTQDLPEIDFFSLDVEGYELNVLKGLNLSKYRPKYLLVEARFFDEVNAFLEQHHYELVEKMSVHDYLYRCQ
ncbi:MAG: FkbM family methyltransferase [Pirellulales bacterium]